MAQAPTVYDPDSDKRPGHTPSDDELRDITGIDASSEDAIDLDALQRAEAGGGGETESSEPADDDESDIGFNDDEPPAKSKRRGRFSLRGLSARKKWALGAGGVAVVTGLVGGFMGITNLLNAYKLDHFLSNVEAKSFIRYQVDMDGRSTKWINAYIRLRMAEVDDPNVAPQDRENLIFRSNRVDTNSPTKDWYKSLRASKFEQEVFEKQGIKFTSVAQRKGNQIVFRPGIITFNNEPIKFNLSKAETDAIQSGNINNFNGRLSQFIDVQVLESDKAGRKEIKKFVKDNTHSYQIIKRFYVRRSIQNMTGVRSWKFFEQTRNKTNEKIISVRNRVIVQALPESTKSGKFIQCLFGITTCKGNTDPNDPANHADSALAIENCSATSTNPACKNGGSDGNPDTKDGVINDGTVPDELGSGLSDGLTDAATADLSKTMISKLLAKFNVATSVVSILDTLNKVNTNIHNHSLSKMVYSARAAQAIGLFTVYGIARDQIHTGEVSSEEAAAFMDTVSGTGSSEGWNTVINPSASGSTVSAASMQEAASKKEYCSPEHQAAMLLPKNKTVAANEYHYLCDSEKIGGNNLATTIENGWNESIGNLLAPIFAVYNKTGLGTVVSWVNSLADAIVGPVIQGIISGLGLDGTIKSVVSWATVKAADILGATPSVSANSPDGVKANHVLMGGSASAEAATRFAGAAVTSDQTAAIARKNVIAYQSNERASQSIVTRYASLSNQSSVLSNSLFALTTTPRSSFVSSTLRTFGDLPNMLFGSLSPVHAANDTAYAAANFGGVETYDFPNECLNADPLTMTPQSSTNADELGIISADELTWELMSDSDAFYAKLYELNPDGDVIKKVYDCAALDSMARGGLGALYASDTVGNNGIQATGDASSSSDSSTSGPVSSDGWTWPVAANIWHGPFGNNIWGSCSVECRHAGIDIGVGSNTPVLAAHDGTIIQQNSTTSGYGGGYLVKVDGQKVWYAYQHMRSAPLKVGTHITAGQKVGESDCTGNCFGPHLHFSIERSAHISAYAEGKGVCDVASVACAIKMPSYPPLCFLPKEGITYGGTVSKDQIIGSDYCAKVLGS